MVKVEVNEKGFFIGGTELPLLSGEFHYWRVNKSVWSKILDRFIEAGFRIVATYVPWNYHETKPGKYDFEGKTDPQRDLEGFLSLCEQKNLHIIIRPGPYIYAEWLHRGPPAYAAKHHRLSEAYFKAAADYIEAISRTLGPHQITRGGGIIMLQADNEIDPWPRFYRTQLGLNGGHGPFQRYLKSTYRSIKRLNLAWETRYNDFAEVKAFEATSNFVEHRVRNLDYRLFLEWYVCEVAKKIVSMYRSNGIEVPICLNTYPSYTPQNFHKLQKIADIVGIDPYPTNMLKNDFDYFIEILKYTKATLKFPYIAEFECGIWYGMHYDVGTLGPIHYEFKDLLALACGNKGWNYYMMVNRDNWMMSPINEWGRVHHDVFSWMKKIAKIFRELNVSSLRELCDISVLAYRPHKLIDTGNWNEIQRSLHQVGLDYQLYDPWTEENPKTSVLIYAGANFMLKRDQEKLRSFIENGGTILFFVSPPTQDLNGARVETLLEIAPPPSSSKDIRWEAEPFEISLKEAKKLIKLKRFWTYDTPSGFEGIAIKRKNVIPKNEEDSFLYNLESGAAYTAGYLRKVGKGRILTLGLEPSSEVVALALEALKVPYYARASIPNVLTTTYRGEGKHVVFAVNNSIEARGATISIQTQKLGLDPEKKYTVSDLVCGEKKRMTGEMLSNTPVGFKPYEVKILEIIE